MPFDPIKKPAKSAPAHAPLPCPDCEDGTRWVSRYGGNDPDVWARQCESCDGDGIQRCEHRADRFARCGCEAVAINDDGAALCDLHLGQWADEQAEDGLEAEAL